MRLTLAVTLTTALAFGTACGDGDDRGTYEVGVNDTGWYRPPPSPSGKIVDCYIIDGVREVGVWCVEVDG